MNHSQPVVDLFESHRPHLEMLGRRLARDAAEAEDLVQETFLRAYVHVASFTPGTNARAWLGRILRNLFVDRQRKRRADQRMEGALAHEPIHHFPLDPGSEIDGARVRRRVRAALDTVPEPFRRAVELVDLEGLDYESAARELGCPEGTIMSRVHRGRRRVRESLSPDLLPALVA